PRAERAGSGIGAGRARAARLWRERVLDRARRSQRDLQRDAGSPEGLVRRAFGGRLGRVGAARDEPVVSAGCAPVDALEAAALPAREGRGELGSERRPHALATGAEPQLTHLAAVETGVEREQVVDALVEVEAFVMRERLDLRRREARHR